MSKSIVLTITGLASIPIGKRMERGVSLKEGRDVILKTVTCISGDREPLCEQLWGMVNSEGWWTVRDGGHRQCFTILNSVVTQMALAKWTTKPRSREPGQRTSKEEWEGVGLGGQRQGESTACIVSTYEIVKGLTYLIWKLGLERLRLCTFAPNQA